MIRTTQWKLALHPRGPKAGRVELYDLEKDPHELKNLGEDAALAAVIRDLSAKMLEHMRAIGDPAAAQFKQ